MEEAGVIVSFLSDSDLRSSARDRSALPSSSPPASLAADEKEATDLARDRNTEQTFIILHRTNDTIARFRRHCGRNTYIHSYIYLYRSSLSLSLCVCAGLVVLFLVAVV